MADKGTMKHHHNRAVSVSSEQLVISFSELDISSLHVLVSAALFLAGAICWYDPFKAPALLFFACSALFLTVSSALASSKREAVRNISEGVTHSLVEFSQNPQQSEPLIAALSQTLRVTLTNEELTSTLRNVAIQSMRDETLQADVLDTLSGALIRASQDAKLKKVLLTSIEQGLSDALKDEEFMNGMFQSMVHAMVSASQNSDLRQAVLNVTTEAVSVAVRDERFMEELKCAIRDCLKDGAIYRAGATGLINGVLRK